MGLPQVLQEARAYLCKKSPYMSHIVYSLTPVESPGLGTMAVDEYHRLYYDPDLGKKWDMQGLAAVLDHECWHLLSDHPRRRPRGEEWSAVSPNGQQIGGWNIATDMAINWQIKAEGTFHLPDGCLYPADYKLPDGLSAEEYYDKLPKQMKQPGQDGSGGDGAVAVPSQGNCGSAADGIKRSWESGAPGEGNPVPGLDADESAEIRQQVAKSVKSQGDAPAGVKRWAEQILDPQVSWQRVLTNLVRSSMRSVAGAVDYTWRRPSRRRLPEIGGRRAILPGLHWPQPHVGLVLDTSGSMGNDRVSAALAEVKGVLKACAGGIEFYSVDAAVTRTKNLRKLSGANLVGGGGTDMGLGIQAAAEDGVDVCVVLTDGWTPWPATKPKGVKHVIVVIVGDQTDVEVPAWAKMLRIAG